MIDPTTQEVRTAVDQILQIVKDHIGEPVIRIYRERFDAPIYLYTIKNVLKQTNPNTNVTILEDDNTLLENLDLSNWLNLITERWDVFEPTLKNLGRGYVKSIKDLRNRWAHHEEIMLRDAREGARSAAQLLDLLGQLEASKELNTIHDSLELQLRRVVQPGFVGTDSLPEASPDVVPAPRAPVDYQDDGNTELLIAVDNNSLHLEIVHPDGAASANIIPLLEDRVVIGRSESHASIKVNDPRVSRVHLLIAKISPPELLVTDLMSANGTTLDGKKLPANTPTPWKVGQMISVGSTWLILRHGAA